MAKPQKRPSTPVTEQLKAERIQVLLAQRPDLLLSGIQVALGPLTLFLTPADGKTLTKEDLELAAALQKAA